MSEKPNAWLTLVFPVRGYEQRTKLLAQSGWSSCSHDNAIAQRTNAEAVVQHLSQQLSDANDEIKALKAQLDAVGAGGMEPLRQKPPELTPKPPELTTGADQFLDAKKMVLEAPKPVWLPADDTEGGAV